MLTQSELKAHVNYDEVSGIFTWIKPVSKKTKIGNLLGTPMEKGYIQCGFKGKKFLLHRLAWLYVYGYFPKEDIDHINGIKNDNRISNLRECTHQENIFNTGLRVNNTSGCKNVTWHKNIKKWVARISLDGIHKHLGTFSKIEDANECYQRHARKIHGEFYKPN